MYKSMGFSEELELKDSKETDYPFLGGKLPDEILVEDGDWTPYLPVLEVQRNDLFDTYSCVSFSHNNCIEAIHKRRYGKEINRSDRYTSIISSTIPGQGNSHINVAEMERFKGFVYEEECPFLETMTQSEFFTNIPKEIENLGISRITEYEYGYEKVKRDDFAEALKRSPLQVAVDSRANTRADFKGLDHSTMLYALKDTAKLRDSYRNRWVDYSLDYPFSYALRYHYKMIEKIKVVDPLSKTEYKFELVKSELDPKIYLKDSDGVLHWIETPDTFAILFGRTAFEKKWWSVVPFTDIDVAKKGKSISIKPENIGDVVGEFFKILGIK